VDNTLRRKICVVLVDRANYGRLKPVMQAIQTHPVLQLQVLAGGTMVLERFHQPVEVVRADGFNVDGEIYIELEGSTPATMAKSVGFGVVEFASEFQRLKPDIAHIQGGEVSGSIDESARHAITKFAHFHFPSTERSAVYLERMGEAPDTILNVGCPSSDIARQLDSSLSHETINDIGSGAQIDAAKPFMLVVFHPTTTEYGGERRQMEEMLQALKAVKTQTILLWPNIDAGADHISKAVRMFRDQEAPTWLRVLTNLSPENYLKVLSHAVCAIGNSSSFVRDASYFGTPVVLVGKRQAGRETDEHVTTVEPIAAQILTALRRQLMHGRYPASTLYGDGWVSAKIADALARITPYIQKRLHYIYDNGKTSYGFANLQQLGAKVSSNL